jgi:uncharacterized protein DUF29
VSLQELTSWRRRSETPVTLPRDQKTQALDCTNLAEEIESLGHSDKRELGDRRHILVRHLLQWPYQGACGR